MPASVHINQQKVLIQVFYYRLNFFTAFKNLKKINICFTAASHICINTTKPGISPAKESQIQKCPGYAQLSQGNYTKNKILRKGEGGVLKSYSKCI